MSVALIGHFLFVIKFRCFFGARNTVGLQVHWHTNGEGFEMIYRSKQRKMAS